MDETGRRQAGGGPQLLRPTGRLDLGSAPNFRAQVRLLMDEGATNLIIDMTEVVSMDSSGLGAITFAVKLARRAGGDAMVVGANPRVRLMLDRTSMSRIVHTYATVEAALADFASSKSPRVPE